MKDCIHRLELNETQFLIDVGFLYSRGYLNLKEETLLLPKNPALCSYLRSNNPRESEINEDLDMLDSFRGFLQGSKDIETEKRICEFLMIDENEEWDSKNSWIADGNEVELGFRLIDLFLALKIEALSIDDLSKIDRAPGKEIRNFFKAIGYLDSNLKPTELGKRIYDRGQGPMGIIQAYAPYMKLHSERTRRSKPGKIPHVRRKANIKASKLANKKSFTMINSALDRFCENYNFEIKTYIEHALGEAEAIRQRLTQESKHDIQYVGVDLESPPIEVARQGIELGELPKSLILKSDIL